MSEIIAVACAAVFGVSTLIGCLLLPKSREPEEATVTENTHLINDAENNTDQCIKIQCKPIIILKFNKSYLNKKDNTLVAADFEQIPYVISQSISNNGFKLPHVREVSKENDHHSSVKSSEISQKSVSTDNSRYDTFQNSDRLTDNSEKSRTVHDNSSSIRKTFRLQKEIAVPATDSNSSLIINKELQNVAMQAALPKNNIDSLKPISNAVPELMIPQSIQKNVLKVRNSYYRFNDCSEHDDTEYYKIPAVPLLHSQKLQSQAEQKTKSTIHYPSTSTRIGSKYTFKNSWRNISKHIDSLFAKIRKFL